jgi:hypothetical protein
MSSIFQQNIKITKTNCFPDGLKSWYDILFTSIFLKMSF